MQSRPRTTLAITFAFVVIMIGAGVLNTQGYVLTKTGIYQGAQLTITDVPAGTTVFIHNKKRGTATEEQKDITVTGIKPGEQDVIVSFPTAWPWVARYNFTPEVSYTLHPVLLPRQARRVVITPSMKGYDVARDIFARATLPTGSAPLASADATALVWSDGNTIYTRAGGAPITTFSGKSTIRSLGWFLDRNDTIIVATDTEIFAIGIYPSSPQNFLPIYTGTAPVFALDGSNEPRILIKNTAQDKNITLLELAI